MGKMLLMMAVGTFMFAADAGAETKKFDQSCRGFADTFLVKQGLGSFGNPNGKANETLYVDKKPQPYFVVTSDSGHLFRGQAAADSRFPGGAYTVEIQRPAPKKKPKREEDMPDPLLAKLTFEIVDGKCVLREIEDHERSRGPGGGITYNKKDCDQAVLTHDSKDLIRRLCQAPYSDFFAEDRKTAAGTFREKAARQSGGPATALE